MARYRQPRRLNLVSSFMLLSLLVLVYVAWCFGPVYLNAWTVDHLLTEAASSTYRISHYAEPERSQGLKQLLDQTRAAIQTQAQVTDPDLALNLDLDGDLATVSADYSVVVPLQFTARSRRLQFHRQARANIKTVKWE